MRGKGFFLFIAIFFLVITLSIFYYENFNRQRGSESGQNSEFFESLLNTKSESDLFQQPIEDDLVDSESGGEPSLTGTTITLSETPIWQNVVRLGLNLDSMTYWDSGQIHKNLIEEGNVNFEPTFKRIMINCDSSSSGSTCTSEHLIGAWCDGGQMIESIPAGFYNGATYEIVLGTGKGTSGTITNYQYLNQCSTTTKAVFTLSGFPVDGTSYIVIRKNYNIFDVSGLSSYHRWFFSKTGAGQFSTQQADLPTNSQGTQTLRLSAPIANTDSISATINFDTNNARRYVYLNGQYRVSFWAKSLGGNNQLRVTSGRSGGTNHYDQTIQLSNSWQIYNLDFPILESRGNLAAIYNLVFRVSGSTILLDDVSFRQTDDSAQNPTQFRDSAVSQLKSINPGILRFWAGQLGDTLDNLIAHPSSRNIADYSGWETYKDDKKYYSLTEFLQLSEHLGSEPWIVVPTMFTNQEMANLIEYLAGPSNTIYGGKRTAQGHPAPWTDSFSKIHIELGNENWNGLFASASIQDIDNYAIYGNESFASAKNSPYFNPNKFQLTFGVQSSSTYQTQRIQQLSQNHDAIAIAPYLYNNHNSNNQLNSFSNNEQLFGPLFAETQQLNSINGYLYAQKQAILTSSRPSTKLSIYEVNLHSDHGALGNNQQAIDSLNPSLGAGLAVGSHMLQSLRQQGILSQAFFTFTQSSSLSYPNEKSTKLWGLAHNYDYGQFSFPHSTLVRPHFYVLQMINRVIKSTMITTTHSGDDPSWNQVQMNTVNAYSNAKYLLSYAFKEGNQYSVVVFNLHRTDPLDITLSLPFVPNPNAERRTFTSSQITNNNENSLAVSPSIAPSVVVQMTGFSQQSQFTLPNFSITTFSFSSGTSGGFDYSLSSNPNSLNISRGQAKSTTTSVSLVSGTPQTVSFGTSGLPLDVSVGFNPSSCLVPCQTIATFTVGPNAPIGTTTVQIEGLSSFTRSTPLILNITLPPQPPTAPSNLRADTISSNSINLFWVDTSNNEDRFELERRQLPSGTFTVIANNILPNSQNYVDNGLSASTSYEYRIRAVNNSLGSSAWSNVASNTTKASPPSLTNLNPNSIVHNVLRTVRLNGNNFASAYAIYVRSQSQPIFTFYCNSASAYCRRQSATAIDMDIPAGTAAGIYDIKVINSDLQESNFLSLTIQASVCLDGAQRACQLTQGVCAGSTETCTGGQWPGCTGATYQSNANSRFGVNYESSSETLCDGQDNNCDGQIDNIALQNSPLCSNQQGVCSGAKRTCGGTSGWLVCGTTEYQNNNANYRASEVSTLAGICTDSLDNDCDGEYDYAGSGNGLIRGDNGCPVAVTGISAPSQVLVNTQFTLDCNTNPDNVASSINGSLDGVACNLVGGGSNLVSFNCISSSTPKTQVARCDVNPSYSYQSGSSFSSNVNVMANPCSNYNSQSTCPTTTCSWCEGCSGNQYNGVGSRCVPIAQGCGSYSCTINQCGATCNGASGCTQTQTCNLNSCGCTEQNPSLNSITPQSFGWSESGVTITLSGNYFATDAEVFVNSIKINTNRYTTRTVNTITFVYNPREFRVGNNQFMIRNPTQNRNSTFVSVLLNSNPSISLVNPDVVTNNMFNEVNITGNDFDPNSKLLLNGNIITQNVSLINNTLIRYNISSSAIVGDYNLSIQGGDSLVESNKRNLRINAPFNYIFSVNGSIFNLNSTDLVESFTQIETNYYMFQENVYISTQVLNGINITLFNDNCVANLSLTPPSCKVRFNITTTNLSAGSYSVKISGLSSHTLVSKDVNITINVGGGFCGDNICNASIGETCSTCSADCGGCGSSGGGSSGGGGGGGGSGGRGGPRILQQCEDGLDNDNDGKVDYPADPGCFGLGDSTELDASELTRSNYTLDGDGTTEVKLDVKKSSELVVFWVVLMIILTGIIIVSIILFKMVKKINYHSKIVKEV